MDEISLQFLCMRRGSPLLIPKCLGDVEVDFRNGCFVDSLPNREGGFHLARFLRQAHTTRVQNTVFRRIFVVASSFFSSSFLHPSLPFPSSSFLLPPPLFALVMSATSLPATVPAPAPVSNGPNAIQKLFQDKDWKLYAAVASVSLLAGAGLYFLTRDSASSTTPEAKSSKSKKKKNNKKKKASTAKESTTSDEKSTLPSLAFLVLFLLNPPPLSPESPAFIFFYFFSPVPFCTLPGVKSSPWKENCMI